jgi:MarR family transcriptional regulator, negative regulator of the multidrug operon emrRAB
MHTNPPAPPNLARTANLLGALSLEATHAQSHATRQQLGKAGEAAAALVLIAADPGRTIERLRAPLGLSQPGATRLMQRLAAEGWIVLDGPGGRRGLQVRLTAAGERMLDALLAVRRAALTELLDPLSDAELTQLSGLLERLLAARTSDRAALERLCRLCDRPACAACPVGRALDAILAAGGRAEPSGLP